MEQLILARHGETEWNTRQLVNGDPAVDVRLSEQGREEARRLGAALAGEQVDLCVTSGFPRTDETAELALGARSARRLDGARQIAEVPARPAPEREIVPKLVVADLGDPDYGSFEGGPLEEYRAWAAANPSSAAPGGDGEARHAIVGRYARGFRLLLARPERTILAVLHSLPVAYALAAREGRPPVPRVPIVGNAHLYRFTRDELEQVAELLEGWCASPSW